MILNHVSIKYYTITHFNTKQCLLSKITVLFYNKFVSDSPNVTYFMTTVKFKTMKTTKITYLLYLLLFYQKCGNFCIAHGKKLNDFRAINFLLFLFFLLGAREL